MHRPGRQTRTGRPADRATSDSLACRNQHGGCASCRSCGTLCTAVASVCRHQATSCRLHRASERCVAAPRLMGSKKNGGLYELARQNHPRDSLWSVTGSVRGALQSPVLAAEVVTMKEIYREIAHPAYPYCPTHNRLCPHPVVSWLTSAYPEKLPTFQAMCDRCTAEERARVILCYPPSRLP